VPPSRRAQERERVKEAADFCADSLSGGWQAAVAERATDYAQNAWKRLSRSRRKRNCKKLARMAREILTAKDQIHKLAGELAGDAASVVGVRGAALDFSKELVANIPLPTDAKMVAVARGVQIAGILLCVMNNRDLTKCECFIDLAMTETKEQVKRMLVAAMSDWAEQRRPGQARSRHGGRPDDAACEREAVERSYRPGSRSDRQSEQKRPRRDQTRNIRRVSASLSGQAARPGLRQMDRVSSVDYYRP
jgi:ribosomal protein L18E